VILNVSSGELAAWRIHDGTIESVALASEH
jgi:hypothetical protein